MTDAGYEFAVVVPGATAECGICSNGGPAALVGDLALRKAAEVAGQLALRQEGQPALIIAWRMPRFSRSRVSASRRVICSSGSSPGV